MKFEVTYVPKGTKMYVTEYVEATCPAYVRTQIRSTEGMVKFIEITECPDDDIDWDAIEDAIQRGIVDYPVAG